MKLPPLTFPKKEATTTIGKNDSMITIKSIKPYKVNNAFKPINTYLISISEYNAFIILSYFAIIIRSFLMIITS